jgi:hypothetical protein
VIAGMHHDPASHFPTRRNAHPPKSSYLENKQECDVSYTTRQRKGGSTKFERKIQSASDDRKIPKPITCLFRIKWRARECILLRNLPVQYLDQRIGSLVCAHTLVGAYWLRGTEPFGRCSVVQEFCRDRLCGPVVRVPRYRFRGPGSIPGATIFSEK